VEDHAISVGIELHKITSYRATDGTLRYKNIRQMAHRSLARYQLEQEESRLAIRGNPQNRFARKSPSKGQKPANSIT
jgi:hypothetical protein